MKDQAVVSAKRKPYDSDPADARRSVPEPMLPPLKLRGKPRKTDLRESSQRPYPRAALRMPLDARSRRDPPPQTVYTYFQNAEALRNFEANPQGERGFTVLPKRWVVERAPARLGGHRGLSEDCESQAETWEAWIRTAMVCLAPRRLAA